MKKDKTRAEKNMTNATEATYQANRRRRKFLTGAMAAGTGAIAAGALLPGSTLTAQTPSPGRESLDTELRRLLDQWNIMTLMHRYLRHTDQNWDWPAMRSTTTRGAA